MDTPTWQAKIASSMTEDEKAEQAFMNMAYSVVQNRIKPLMQAPYRLGFEIVYKNLNSTRLVGVFIFRVGKQFIYAPVFFSDGQVKSADLLYNRKTKRFRPATPEQAESLINKSLNLTGRAINAGDLNRGANRTLNPEEMLGLQGKFASQDKPFFNRDPEVKKACSEVWGEMCERADELITETRTGLLPRKLLPEFLKAAANTSIPDRLHTALCKATPATDAFVRTYTDDDLFPEELIEKQAAAVKQAAANAPQAEEVKIHLGLVKGASATAKASIAEKGYFIEDTRKEASYSARLVDDSESYMAVAQPGIFRAIKIDGDGKDEVDIAVVPSLSIYLITQAGYKTDKVNNWPELYADTGTIVDASGMRYPAEFQSPYYQRTSSSLYSDGRAMCTLRQPIAAKVVTDEDVNGVIEKIFTKASDLQKDAHYLVIDLKHFISLGGPVPYKGKSEDALGNEVFEFGRYPYLCGKDSDVGKVCDCVVGSSDTFEVTHGRVGHIAVPHLGFIKVEDKPVKATPLLTMDDVTDLFHEPSVSQISVNSFTGNGDTIVTVSDGSKKASRAFMTKLAAITYLMCTQGLSEDDATDIVNHTGRTSAIVKQANSQRLTQQGEEFFSDGVDTEFGLPLKADQTLVLSTNRPDYQSGNRIDSRIGDRLPILETPGPDDPAADLNLDAITPSELIELAKHRQTRPIFDHGEVASLAKTTDSIALIESMMGDLELGLDRPGRILFLINWKPGDFQQAYGIDDVRELETIVLAAFKSYGNCVLELEKRLPGSVDQDTTIGSD